MIDMLHYADDWQKSGQPIALARVIATRGSSPRPIGSSMIISADCRFAGSVSGGCVDGEVIRIASEVISQQKACLTHFRGDADPLTEISLDCEGDETIFIEPLTDDAGLLPAFASLLKYLEGNTPCTFITHCKDAPTHWILDSKREFVYGNADPLPDFSLFVQEFAAQQKLIIIGADAIGQAVADFAKQIGWHVTVIDPRAAWLTLSRFPYVDRIIDFPDTALSRIALTPTTAIVVLSHDPKIDEPALQIALNSNAYYIGALGSRKAHAIRQRRLHATGLDDKKIARLYAPIGLDLGGYTPQEVAISIIAEILAVRNHRPGASLREGVGAIHSEIASISSELAATERNGQ
jgi:xanthine dehydrogenase accessory factor